MARFIKRHRRRCAELSSVLHGVTPTVKRIEYFIVAIHACCWPMQVYAGDELGYSETPETKNMTIAVTDVGGIDGGDEVKQAVVRGIVVPTVGYGGMNMHMFDVSQVPNVQVSASRAFANFFVTKNTPWLCILSGQQALFNAEYILGMSHGVCLVCCKFKLHQYEFANSTLRPTTACTFIICKSDSLFAVCRPEDGLVKQLVVAKGVLRITLKCFACRWMTWCYSAAAARMMAHSWTTHGRRISGSQLRGSK